MIFYFTATGNSLAAANIIADTTGDELIDLGLAYKKGQLDFYVEQGENLGFVFPVYAWSTPGIVDDFLRKAHFITPNGRTFAPGYCYCVITCGMIVGKTADFFAKMLQRYQNIRLDASFSVNNVGNCVILYGMPDAKQQKIKQLEANRQAKEVAYLIDGKRMVHQENRNPFGSFMSVFTGREGKKRSVEPFHVVLSKCTGCGTCAAVCPTNTIHMENGLPVWVGDNCTQCLACLHRCPTEASQYGSKTEKRTRYQNPSLKERPAKNPWIPPEVPDDVDSDAIAARIPDIKKPEGPVETPAVK